MMQQAHLLGRAEEDEESSSNTLLSNSCEGEVERGRERERERERDDSLIYHSFNCSYVNLEREGERNKVTTVLLS